MFERFVDAGMQKHMLEVQYRMYPTIRRFPSDAFYEGKISDGDSVLTRELDKTMTSLAA
jgi:senataxin